MELILRKKWFHVLRTIKNNKGKKDTYFCALVESNRDNNTFKHRVLLNFGLMLADSVTFLKVAYAKKKPLLVWDDHEGS